MANNHDHTDDDDIEKKNIDKDDEDDEDEEDDEADDADKDSKEDDDDDKDKDDDDSDEDEIKDDEPVTGKSFKKLQKTILDSIAVIRRHSQKDSKQFSNKGKPTHEAKDRDIVASRVDRLEESDRKRQFGFEHSLSPMETDLVFQFSRNPSKKTLKHPFVAGGLEKLRSRKNADDNIPSGHAFKSFKVNGKEWKELTPEERQANFADRQKGILKTKRQ